MKIRSIYSTLVVLFLFSSSILAQIDGEISWSDPRVSNNISYPYFEGAALNRNYPELPQECFSKNYTGSVNDIISVEVIVVRSIPATVQESKALSALSQSDLESYSPKVTRVENRLVINMCFLPFTLKNGRWEKVTSYQVNYSVKGQRDNYKGKTSKVTASSVLSTENWHKISVSKTAMHKITPAFLSENNISSGEVLVSDLRIVGNGTGMLPEANSIDRPADLLEVPLKIVDQNNNGVFDGNDYALFYAQGPNHNWTWTQATNVFTHKVNLYRNLNYYFISTKNGGSPSVVQSSFQGNATVQINSFDDYTFIEDENENLQSTGRSWVGDLFSVTNNLNYNFSFPNVVSGENGRLKMVAVGRASTASTTITASLGGVSVISEAFARYPTLGDYPSYVTTVNQTASFQPLSDNLVFNVSYNNSSNPSGIAWLDFLEVQVRRNLVFSGSSLLFRDGRSVQAGEIGQFNISSAPSGLSVWKVSDHNNIESLPLTYNNGVASFVAPLDDLEEYVAFNGSSFDVPEYVSSLDPQDIHGASTPEMVIVVHPSFLSAAEDLAAFHEETDGLESLVVTTEEVYNEFSSGGQDITAIRDMSKMFFDRQDGVYKYLLLFGDASYDYKDRLTGNDNYVPVYESSASYSLSNSFITDDYYGYLDNSEGSGGFSGNGIDIAIGRIPARSLGQAQSYVNKVKVYSTGENRFGDWRNRILLVADDLDEANWETAFVNTSEQIEDRIDIVTRAFNVDKVYIDSYVQQSSAGSEAYPEASRDFYQAVQQGNLITNYVGHGGEIGLASERILTLQQINSWSNLEKMPLFITITCEFTRFDDPERVSAGEQVLSNSNGGAIALISTTRVVNESPASTINRYIFDTILGRVNYEPQRLGDLVKFAKNQSNVINDNIKDKFSLIGDPAVRLAIPYHKIEATELNGKSIALAQNDTIKARQKVSAAGRVLYADGSPMNDFNGVVNVSVYDKPSPRKTLVNDGIGPALSFNVQNNLIYRGKSQAVNGDFKFEFIVPKDISFKYGNGKMSFYATDEVLDAAGFHDSLLVGGIDDQAIQDDIGPEVALFMNDENFVRGGTTGPNPAIFALLADSSGVNTVGNGVGHDLKAVIDENTESAIILNEYYEADLDSYQKGTVTYPLYDLEPGPHSISLKVFDVFNNFTEAETDFVVADDAELALDHVLNYPNPFTTYTEFHFEHNRSNQPMDVQVQIFTVSGKLVKTINRNIQSPGNRVTGIAWNGLDDYGDKIGKGVYVYKVKVKSLTDNSMAEQYEKLVILR